MEAALALWLLLHDHADPNKEWYERQLNSKGTPCCSNNDWANPVDWRRTSNGYQVYMKERWIDVPESAVLTVTSPTGQSVIWYSMPRGDIDLLTIYCFIPGAEG